ncbi:MAG: hypothetical protein U0V74_03825 [Chitinophagales bacterium]
MIKTALKACVLFGGLFISGQLMAQSAVASTETVIPKAEAIKEAPVAPPVGREVTIVVKNTCEKGVAVFAGPRENIKEPKLNAYGGLSTNKVYIHENDVVCLMTSDKKPVACTVIKPGMTTVEVNTSGTGVMGK